MIICAHGMSSSSEQSTQITQQEYVKGLFILDCMIIKHGRHSHQKGKALGTRLQTHLFINLQGAQRFVGFFPGGSFRLLIGWADKHGSRRILAGYFGS